MADRLSATIDLMKLYAAVTAALMAAGLPAAAQTFEVASIHTSKAQNLNQAIHAEPGGRLIAENVTLRTLIQVAYRITAAELVPGPAAKWIDTERYDIRAACESGAQAHTLAELRLQLLALLADRWQLRTHAETREMYAGALMPTKNGIRIQESSGGDGLTRTTKRRIDGAHVTAEQLARALSEATQTLIVDQTGFTGFLDAHIAWTPDGEATTDDSPPPLETVLADAFGLQIRQKKAGVNVLAIDTAAKPTEN
jgi:uncharacterized protein (TIGR03435 family)